MSNIGILIETGEDGVKEANFGVITAARGGGNVEIYAFILDAGMDDYKETLQAYGFNKSSIFLFSGTKNGVLINFSQSIDSLSK